MNAVEREPVETRVLNPTASEASYKSKQRSYRKTNLKNKILTPDSPSAETYPTHITRSLRDWETCKYRAIFFLSGNFQASIRLLFSPAILLFP